MKQQHKHAALIKAWADGAEIEWKSAVTGEWNQYRDYEHIAWMPDYEYRIKPESKPDIMRFVSVIFIQEKAFLADPRFEPHNLILTFDGKTGRLKSAELIA